MAAKARPQDAEGHHPQARRPRQPRAPGDDERERRAAPPASQAMGERTAGPTAKRTTSPQFGAVAPETGRPKMATDPLPASGGADHPGQRQDEGHHHRLQRHHEDAPRRLARAHEERAEHPGHRGDEDHGHDGRREARRGGDDGTEDDDLAHGPAAPVRPGLDRVRGHPGRPGQAQRDEGEHGVGDEPVPAPRAQRAVGQRQPEVADDGDDTGPGRQQRAQATATRPRRRAGCTRGAGPAAASPWRRRTRCR